MKILTTPVPLGSATRWRVVDVVPYDEVLRAVVTVRLLDANGNITETMPGNIQDGLSDRFTIGASALKPILVESGVVLTPTGYSSFMAAWSAGSTVGARRNAAETWLLANGCAGANMAGA